MKHRADRMIPEVEERVNSDGANRILVKGRPDGQPKAA
jgi:hypothetical protein